MLPLLRLFRDERGATAIEYGLVAGLISVTIMMTMQGLGAETKRTLVDIVWNGLYRANNPEQFN